MHQYLRNHHSSAENLIHTKIPLEQLGALALNHGLRKSGNPCMLITRLTTEFLRSFMRKITSYWTNQKIPICTSCQLLYFSNPIFSNFLFISFVFNVSFVYSKFDEWLQMDHINACFIMTIMTCYHK